MHGVGDRGPKSPVTGEPVAGPPTLPPDKLAATRERNGEEALRRLQARLGDDNIDDLIRLAYGSADFREGMAAFLAKRAPKWSGT